MSFDPNAPVDNVVSLPECTNNQGESLNDSILQKAGWLHGYRMDDICGPRVSARQVALYVDGATAFVQDTNELSTETIVTSTKRETNYVHHGWSMGAIATVSPWTLSRIAARNHPNAEGTWYTKLTKAKRLKVEVMLEDLVPVPEFKAAIENALEQPTTYEKFQAIYCALDRWGDVVPLEIEIGSSLAMTDTEIDHLQFPETGERNFNSAAGLSTIKTADITVVGDSFGWNDGKCTTEGVMQDPQWHTIKTKKTAPTINLLARELQTQLSELYARRLSYVPSDRMGPLRYYHKTYDDNQHSLKTISSVMIRFSDFIELLTATYSDGTISSKHGGGGHVGTEHKFILATDEHITEMLIWRHEGWVRGFQFITSMGRCSPQYGTHDGLPTIARSKGGVLAGFLIHTSKHSQHGQMYSDVQGVWRHDLIPRVLKEDDVYSDYFGDSNGHAFNDRVLIGNSNSIRVTSVEIRSGDCIDSIQFTYVDVIDGREFKSTTPRHGGTGGSPHQFVLEDGEHIVTVSGWHGEQRITQLCFGTNRGRTSEVYGAGKGQSFSSLAPRDKDGNYLRLQYICGKGNDSSLTGVMFVWTPC
ncbi:jacalin-like lectin domain protein [Rhizoctonia solani 123E]|uniref:Jacalin-like lectin domain protein n=1 Tax=Rhizoctonia solani 123E TaxID=1423351 RepID=A0A074RMV9_9AGAM|nr:jacalin-like lectin domain protein [Rhizoctonia solani 123E]